MLSDWFGDTDQTLMSVAGPSGSLVSDPAVGLWRRSAPFLSLVPDPAGFNMDIDP